MIVKLEKNENTFEILRQISELEKETFANNAYSYETLVEILEASDNYDIYVYLKDEKVLAYLLIMDNIDCYEILKIATRNSYRKMGIAGKLLKEIKSKDIFLEVRESNTAAIKFYEKNFFKRISIRKNYYKDNNENAIIMKMEVTNE